MKISEIGASPLFSPLSIILATAAMIILAGIFFWKGNSIFSPGALSAQNTRGLVFGAVSSHAELENQCKQCHQPLLSSQGRSCMQCHTDIASQVQQKSGLHGNWEGVENCRNCHSDHQGRDFDMLADALRGFDHSQTALPLSGKHLELTCQECHTQDRFQISALCADCHAEPTLHAGLFQQDCTACHTTLAWQPAQWQGRIFDHEQAAFSLLRHTIDYQNASMACTACHQTGTMKIDQSVCLGCHTNADTTFMQAHSQQFGLNCTDCHDGRDRMHNFEHGNIFLLDGAHAVLECQSCHADQRFSGTPSECAGCHAEPAIHAGSFGLNCAACHSTQAWLPAVLLSHRFPLDHGEEGEIACTTCHLQTYSQYTCESCHDSQDSEFIKKHSEENITGQRLTDCVACHADGETDD